ncbi:MAG: molybdopterin-synthase adenylyltransferase MoeB [Pseudomonadales bacterium]
MSDMSDEELLRYSRQIMLPEIDVGGQDKLLDASAMILGVGGLGSPAAIYLASAGVGRIVLVDDDQVDLSNLQRQIIHRQDTIGESKVTSAARSLLQLNPGASIDTVDYKLEGDELIQAVSRVDIVLDATDNFAARYALNDACWTTGTPLVSGAAIRWEGQVAVFDPRQPDSPCYRCLYAEGDDSALNCSENGVIAPLVGIIGSCQAMEAIKLLTDVGDSLAGYVLYFDAKRMEWRKLRLPRNPTCPTCSN